MCGKIKTLIGHARLELGQSKEAAQSFNEAMKLYGYPFPTKRSSIKLQAGCLEIRQLMGLYLCPSLNSGNVDGYDAEFCDNVSECLALMCTLFIVSNSNQ